MSKNNNIWERNFYIVSLLLLTSILFGYFLSSMAFGIWFAYCLITGIKNKSYKTNKKLVPFLLFTLFIFLSIIWSQDQSTTFNAISRQLPLFLFPLAGIFLPPISTQSFKRMFNLFCIFMSGLALTLIFLAILKYNRYQYEAFLYYHELVSPLKLNAIYVSYIVSVCFLYILQIINKKIIWKILVLIVLGVFLVLLVSKMILFITFLLAIMILILKLKSRSQRFIIIVSIVATLFFITKYAQPIENRFSTEFDTSFSEIMNTQTFEKGRVYTGLEARLLQIRVFKEVVDTPLEFFFGVGLDASKEEIQQIHKRLNTPKAFQKYNFHNQYIQVFAELGIIGLSIFLLMLVVGFIKSFKINYFLPFMIISASLFFSESVIWRQRGILFFGIMYILLITISQSNESKEPA